MGQGWCSGLRPARLLSALLCELRADRHEVEVGVKEVAVQGAFLRLDLTGTLDLVRESECREPAVDGSGDELVG